ncbi:MAG: hypothetical protein KHX35_06390 [Sutterella wadsworthensis]|nr:hypothetical protein [Sutterella wadsworthensis]
MGKKIFATGSSSLELANGVKESAVGRLIHRQMWPLSVTEITADKGWANNPHELDFLEVKNEKIRAFECKLSPNAKARPGKFTTAYPNAPIQVVTPNDLMKLWCTEH